MEDLPLISGRRMKGYPAECAYYTADEFCVSRNFMLIFQHLLFFYYFDDFLGFLKTI